MRIRKKEWDLLKPVFEDMAYVMLKRFYMNTVSSVPPSGRNFAISWLHSIHIGENSILQSFIKFMKDSHLRCFVDPGYNHQNSNCGECKLKNRCWDRELVTYWEVYEGNNKDLIRHVESTVPNIQELPKNAVSMGAQVSFPKEQTDLTDDLGPVIDCNDVNVRWCDECEKPVKAVFNRHLEMYVCPEIAKHCEWNCDCKFDTRCGDEHKLLNLEDFIERKSDRLARAASMQSRAMSDLRYSKMKRRLHKETCSDQLGRAPKSRAISKEISRLQARIETLQSIENPPERTVDTRDISDWLVSPVGSLQGVPKKFKTTL